MPTRLGGCASVQVSSSAYVTAANKKGLVYGITLVSGTEDSSIIIKDGGSTGTAKWKLALDGTTAAGETTTSISFPTPIICATDIYATIGGAGALAYVAYMELE